MTRLAVTGYASLDYAFCLAGQIAGDRTTLIEHRNADSWPRIGGCAAYVAMAVAASGREVYPISWVGSDDAGSIYVDRLALASASTAGVARMEGQSSPMSVLAYQADGTCACLFDPAFSGKEALNSSQREIVAASTHLCISVGPPHLMNDILSCRAKGVRLYWILKNDTHCYTPEIRKRLSREAQVIFCSRSERSLIDGDASEAVIVETRGADGVALEWRGKSTIIAVDKIQIRDATGAGDSFAGGFIAAEMSGTDDLNAAVHAGIASARKMLEQRSAEQRR